MQISIWKKALIRLSSVGKNLNVYSHYLRYLVSLICTPPGGGIGVFWKLID